METKLFDSELRLMELLWANAPCTAKELSLLAARDIGWNKNTTYTVIKKLVDKGVIARSEPGFVCTPLLTRRRAQTAETESLVKRLFHGSKKALFSALLEDEELSPEDLDALKRMIESR